MADTPDYLEELLAKRRAMVGVRATSHGDQSTQFDGDWLDREIARVERVLASGSSSGRFRFAVTDKGV